MAYWMSIEVLDGAVSAGQWAETNGDTITEAALGFGAVDWAWHRHSWGVVFEVAFDDEAAWERFRASDVLNWALDRVPDPVSGLIISRGRGGSSGIRQPRKPKPFAGAGAAALPLPFDPFELEDWHLFAGDLERRRLTLTR